MSYTALYRKFRPSNFEDVKGQDAIVETLKNQIKVDRVGHAYLFTGTRGTGKTSIAKIFARAINCENPQNGSPCGECPTCKAIAAGTSMNVIEMDAASNNGVESVRDIVEEVSYSPTQGKYKVYIIDEVHMLSIGAFNALLKTLEEPPSYVVFILATTEVHKIPITIMSRCQRYDFKRISIDTISDRLSELMEKEQIEVEERALKYIAKTADGSMRDALSLMERCISFHFGEELTYDKVLDVLGAVDTEVFSKMLRCIIRQNVTGCINLLEDIVSLGRELGQFVTDFAWYMRNMLLVKTANSTEAENVIDLSSDNLKRLKEEAQSVDAETIMYYIRVLSELSGQLRFATQKRVLLEMTLVKLCRPQMADDRDALIARIKALEEKLENGVAVSYVASEGNPPSVSNKPLKKAELPAAIPEDINMIISSWNTVLKGITQPLRGYIQNAQVSMSAENELLLVFWDLHEYDWLMHPVHKEEFETALADFVGKNVPVRIVSASSEREAQETYPNLFDAIGMDVDYED